MVCVGAMLGPFVYFILMIRVAAAFVAQMQPLYLLISIMFRRALGLIVANQRLLI